HLFIHGGYWQRFYKQDFSHVAAGLVAHGVAVAVVNYSLCPAVGIGDIIDQMRRAAAFLWRQAETLGVDMSRFQVSGHSAGGHLTAALVATDWPQLDAALPVDLIKRDRKSTRLNSSHVSFSYAVFCLKKKNMASIWDR